MVPPKPIHTVQDIGNRSPLVPLAGLAIAGFIYLAWQHPDRIVDWWDGDDPAVHSGPSPAKGQLTAIFSADDYPASAIRADLQGTTAVRFTVTRRGRADDCVVTHSSGSRALDDRTCRIITRRARFEPARDHQGRRVSDDRHTARIKWVLPAE